MTFAVVLGIVGLILAVMGGQLVLLGGSVFYLAAGIALLVTTVLLFRADHRAAYVFLGTIIVTVAWAIYEVGLDGWAINPRLWIFGLLALWFIFPRVQRGIWQADPVPAVSRNMVRLSVLGVGILLGLLWIANSGWEVQAPAGAGAGTVRTDQDWSAYGADRNGSRYVPHDQINTDNVAQLERAWVFRTGVPGNFKGTPIQVDDRLYLCTGQNIVIALDPDAGTEIWRHDPEITAPRMGFWDTCRGVTHYRAPAEAQVEHCPDRIFTATTDARLIALDARDGSRCQDFGDNGEISLLPGMGDVKPGFYFVTSPPTIASDAIVLGGWVADNQETEEPSGVVRGFNPVSGELLWAWDMGASDRSGLPDEGETYTRGTPNVWSMTSADDELGLVFVPTGNATPDYFGGHRSQVMDAYASSVVAIDARTGQPRWHFQTTHHDIWDYDVPAQPSLVDVTVDGQLRKAVLVPTKRAELFLLDRETGEPIADVTEVAVPQTGVDQERTTATQPFSTGMPSFADPYLDETDMWGFSMFDQLNCRIKYRGLQYDGPMTPPSLEGTILYPGPAGGMNWGSAAIDEANQLAVVNVLHMPFSVTLVPRDEVPEDAGFGYFGIGGRQAGTPYAARTFPMLSPITPCIRPPLGEMAVIDLTTGNIVWRRGVGQAIVGGWGLPLEMGTPYQAGSIVTAGGLIFIGGVLDGRMRALDVMTGEEVWSEELVAPAGATPMSYVSPASGEQYVLVAVPDRTSRAVAANHGEQEEDDAQPAASGGYVIAWKLQES